MSRPFSFAIVHHHLRVGGVTRVIENSVTALEKTGIKIVILTGEALSEKNRPIAKVPICVVDGLGYSEGDEKVDFSILKQRMESAAKEALGQRPDCWHFHNHSLGKNPAVSEVVYSFAQEGYRLLLQIHDFAEDGRAANYSKLLYHLAGGKPQLLEAKLYPQASHVHYAVINGRDYQYLQKVGINIERLHLLPNAVHMSDLSRLKFSAEPLQYSRKKERLFLYPTRAIRRKNMGEFLLWATLGKKEDLFASTLAPENPKEQPIYNHWVKLAQTLRLPVRFNVGKNTTLSFDQLISSSYAIVSTSITEGFGLAFLEPWLMSRPVLGRDLPAITKEFKEKGIGLTSLYENLFVPIEWIGGIEVFRNAIKNAFHDYYQSYQQPLNKTDIDKACDVAIHNGLVEFGYIHERFQEAVIRHLHRSPEDHRLVCPGSLDEKLAQKEVIEKNHATITSEYSVLQYKKRLLKIYEVVICSPSSPVASFDMGSLLDHFLDSAHLSLLRM